MKSWTQTGTFSLIISLLSIIFCLALLFITGFDEAFPVIIVGSVILLLAICLLIFYKLTITVDDTYLAFSLGIGWVKRRYLLSDIESCTPVKNSAIYGIGIRMIPSGWLFNVSGRTAIELTFKNSKNKIRIGTDRPQEIADEVAKKLSTSVAGSYFEKQGTAMVYLPLIIIAAAFIFVMILLITGKKPTDVTFSDSAMTITGMYGISVNYSDILKTDTLQVLPSIKSRTNGFAAGDVLKGHFKLSDGSKVMLYVNEKTPPFIQIETNTTTIYLNFEKPSGTREVMDSIRKMVSDRL